MAIRVVCEECGKRLNLQDRQAGKRVRCPECRSAITVPAEEAEVPVGPRQSSPRRDEDEVRSRPKRPVRKRDEDNEDDRSIAKRPSRDHDRDEDDRPRARRNPSRDHDEDDPPRRRSRDDYEDEPSEKKPKKKKKAGRSNWILWLALGGGGVAVLGLVILVVVLLVPALSSGFSEARYIPDGCVMITSERIGQMRKTRLHEASKAKFGGIGGIGGLGDQKATLHGLDPETVDRVTMGTSGGEMVTVVTSTKSLTPEDVKAGLKSGIGGLGDYTEEKVSGYTLYVGKGGIASFSFCIPESRILVIGRTEAVKKVLTRGGGQPKLSPQLQRAYADANFSATRVMLSSGSAGMGLDAGAQAEAVLMQVDHGSTVSHKSIAYYRDGTEAESARQRAEDSRNIMPFFGGEAAKEAKKNASISRSGSSVTISTYFREQTLIDDLNRR